MQFNFLSKKRLYCQYCSKEMTGGFVGDGKVYDTAPCVINGNPTKFEYKNKKEILQEIKEGKIVHYGKLEKVIDG